MSPITVIFLQIVIIVLIGLLLPCAIRLFQGPTAADRLQAADTITTLLIGMTIVLAVIRQEWMFADIGIALAALSFVATVALARYISEGKVF